MQYFVNGGLGCRSRGANVRETNFRGTNFRGTNFRGTNFRRTRGGLSYVTALNNFSSEVVIRRMPDCVTGAVSVLYD